MYVLMVDGLKRKSILVLGKRQHLDLFHGKRKKGINFIQMSPNFLLKKEKF